MSAATPVAAPCRPRCAALPALADLPLAKPDAPYSLDEVLRIAVIPIDDVQLRAVAIEQFVVGTAAMHSVGVDFGGREKELSDRLHQISAVTPGGIAYKLLESSM